MNVCWTEDGKSLIAAEYVPLDDARTGGIPHWTIDPATGEKTRLDVPKSAHVFAVMPDGKAFVAALYDFDAKKVQLALVSRDGKDMTSLCELHTEGSDPRPSPDGARILFQDYDPSEKPEKDMPRLQRLYVYDLKAKTRARLEEVPLNALLLGYAWSPDAKRIAYIWKQVQPGVPLTYGIDINDPEKKLNPKTQTETESHLVVCDATGKNPKTLVTVKAPSAPQVTIEARGLAVVHSSGRLDSGRSFPDRRHHEHDHAHPHRRQPADHPLHPHRQSAEDDAQAHHGYHQHHRDHLHRPADAAMRVPVVEQAAEDRRALEPPLQAR